MFFCCMFALTIRHFPVRNKTYTLTVIQIARILSLYLIFMVYGEALFMFYSKQFLEAQLI